MSKGQAMKESLLSAILQDPWAKENYIKLIGHLRDTRDEEELNKFREMYASRFLPDPLFWRTWFADIVDLGADQQVHDFFARCFPLCPDTELASDYLSFIEKCVEEKDMTPATFRALLEPVLSTVGLDLVTGGEIWNRYRALEVEEYEDSLESSGDARAGSVIEAKTYIIQSVYTRQLGQPLLGNEKVLQEMESFLEEHCESTDVDMIQPEVIQQKFSAAIEKRGKLMAYEERLLTASDEDSGLAVRVQLWEQYIQFEKEDGDAARTARLYERAILAVVAETNPRGLFEGFADHACSVRDWVLLEAVTVRGIVVSYDSLSMWRLRLLSLELNYRGDETVLAAHDMCLSSGFSSPNDYLAALTLRCDYFRRQLVVFQESDSVDGATVVQVVSKMRESFDKAEQFMAQYYPSWVDGCACILRYRVSVEDSVITELNERLTEVTGSPSDALVSASPAVWEKFMSTFGKVCGVELWKEYVNWALLITRDFNVCRKLLRKALALSAADVAGQGALCAESLRFEERYGTFAEDVVAVISKVNPKLRAIARAQSDQVQAEVAQAAPSACSATVASKVPVLKVEDTNNKRPRDEKQSTTTGELPAKRPKESTGGRDMPPPKQEQPTVQVDAESADGGRCTSIFIKNVSFAATEDEILALCKSCGDIEKSEFLKTDAGKFKGMVHVFFKTSDAAAFAVTSLNGHPIHNRKLTVELFHLSVGAKSAATTADQDLRWHPTTVFASKLLPSCTENDVRKYFEVFGSIRVARLLLDKHSGESKCRALVEFDSPESVPRVLECKHVLDGNKIFVTRSKFPAEAPAGPLSANSVKQRNVNGQDGQPHQTTSASATKSMTSALGLKPRVLKRKAFDMASQSSK